MKVRREDFLIQEACDVAVLESGSDMLFERTDCPYLLLFCKEQYEVRILFLSRSKLVRAVEMLGFMIAEFGLVRGDAGRATATISQAILNSLIMDAEFATVWQYFDSLVRAYIRDTVTITAYEYAADNEALIHSLPLYVKRKVKMAVVKSTDILPEGQSFVIKTLENESGLVVTASETTYIMIGCRGEIYEIEASKFSRSYEITEEKLDVFEQMLDFIPEVRISATKEYVPIDDKAHICYPKQDAKIYAMRLKSRTKIFQKDGQGEYFLGRAGDYMAIRADDIRDMYIIQENVFEQTYEMWEE